MTHRTSRSSRASRRCASVPACTSGRRVRAACTTWSGRSSTTRWTRRWPAQPTPSTSRSTRTTRSRSSTTAAASPSRSMEKEGKPAVEVVLTVLHAGGKFGEGGGYKVSGGLHGVGVSVVNALSEKLDVEIRRDGFTLAPELRPRRAAGPLVQGEATDGDRHGDHLLPDAEVFETLEFEWATLEQRLRETAYLTKGLRITIEDERGEGHKAEFHYEGGIRDFVAYLNENKDPVQDKVIYFEAEGAEGSVEVAMQWNSSYQESIFSFANNINTHEGGSHLSGFRGALTRTLNKYARDKGELKEKDPALSRRGRARGPDRRHLGQARRAAVRGPDQDQARQPGHAGLRRVDRQRPARRVPRGEPEGGACASSASRCRPRRPAPRRARRATSRAASARWRTRRCRASSPTAPCATRRCPSCSSSRATRPAARPSRAATATPRRSSRCAARSSTSRRRASTRCCRTRRSRR